VLSIDVVISADTGKVIVTGCFSSAFAEAGVAEPYE